MKRLITLILAIALCVPLYIPAQAEFQYDLSEYSLLLNIKDVYPIQPGTEEWKKLETLQSKIAACEIPKKTSNVYGITYRSSFILPASF